MRFREKKSNLWDKMILIDIYIISDLSKLKYFNEIEFEKKMFRDEYKYIKFKKSINVMSIRLYKSGYICVQYILYTYY